MDETLDKLGQPVKKGDLIIFLRTTAKHKEPRVFQPGIVEYVEDSYVFASAFNNSRFELLTRFQRARADNLIVVNNYRDLFREKVNESCNRYVGTNDSSG